MNRQAAWKHLLCSQFAGRYATPEHCVVTDRLPWTCYRWIRYDTGYFGQHWTNRYRPRSYKSLRGEKDGARERARGREKCASMPCCIIRGAELRKPGSHREFSLIFLFYSWTAGKAWYETSRSKSQLIKTFFLVLFYCLPRLQRTVTEVEYGVGVFLMSTLKCCSLSKWAVSLVWKSKW